LVELDVAGYLDGVKLLAGDSEIGVNMVVMLLKEGVGNGGRFTEEKGELDAG
jgi:hypothetical protein